MGKVKKKNQQKKPLLLLLEMIWYLLFYNDTNANDGNENEKKIPFSS